MSEPTTPKQDPFAPIMPEDLETVAGGARSTRTSDADVTAMLTQITSSIKDLANKNNQTDPMQMMLIMMLMMGGGGGGGGGVVPAAGYGAAGAMPVINVDTSLSGGGGFGVPICRGKGKKGW